MSIIDSIQLNYTKEEILKIFSEGHNKNEIARVFGYKNNGRGNIEKIAKIYDIDITSFWWFKHPRTPNRIGQRINNFLILDYDETRSKDKGHTYWKVKCECGNPNILSISDDNLIHEKSTSCGRCNTYKRIGQRYGFLEILEVTGWITLPGGKTAPKVKVFCHNCGKESEHFVSNIINSNSISCGCFKQSIGEEKIAQSLKELNISFVQQKTFPDLIDKQPLSYDFYIPKLNLLIEFQGEQHFKPILNWGGEERFKKQQLHDKLKEDYAKEKNINLLKINWKDKNKIDKNYMKEKIGGFLT